MLSLSLIPALTQYLILPFCPESPRYLLLNKAEESEAEAGGSEPGTISASLLVEDFPGPGSYFKILL